MQIELKSNSNPNSTNSIMCGIWIHLMKKGLRTDDSSITSTTSARTRYELFMNSKHRGPDKSTFIDLSNFNLTIGFHRLAIMDVSSRGDQPFVEEWNNKTLYVVCNGEIYNHKKLCTQYGFHLKSGSDCEVILHLYKLLGRDLVNKLDGEFAFCVCEIDNATGNVSLTLGRDQAGIRPMFIMGNSDEIIVSSELKSCPVIIGDGDTDKVMHMKPRHTLVIKNTDENMYPLPSETEKYKEYLNLRSIEPDIFNGGEAVQKISNTFTYAVVKRLESDRPLGCLLSGGLDSSLVAAIAARYLKENGKPRLRTFSIGMDGSTDEYYAKKVAAHIDSNHTHIVIPEEKWVKAVPRVVRLIESYDITSVRASTGQYLICKWISENTDIKVLLIGDGSDELCAGYMYFHNAPSPEELHKENVRLVEDIHMYDVLRADRGVAGNGLEARVPFLDKEFIEMYLSIDPKLRTATTIEKHMLRFSFEGTGLLPRDVLWRKKEAFSDGVSSEENSWFTILQKRIDERYEESDRENKKFIVANGLCEQSKAKETHCSPHTNEARYFRDIFENEYGTSLSTAQLIPYFWLPKWSGEIKEPSARVLDAYTSKKS